MSEIEPFVRNTQYKEELAEKTHIKILDILIAISINNKIQEAQITALKWIQQYLITLI